MIRKLITLLLITVAQAPMLSAFAQEIADIHLDIHILAARSRNHDFERKGQK